MDPSVPLGVTQPPEIASGVALLYYLYETSEAIDLPVLQKLLGTESSKARLAFKYAAPEYLQFQNPPLLVTAEPLDWKSRCQFQCRFKFFDYGVVSVTLQTPFAGSWKDFVALSAAVVGDPDLEAAVSAMLDRRLSGLQPALAKPHAVRMMEDYAIFGMHPAADSPHGAELARQNNGPIAQLLRGDTTSLSDQEVAEVMSGALSYYPDDFLVAGWNAAFVFDSPSGLETTAEIFEFANSQLLEYRYYDEILTAQLGAVYDEMARRGRTANLLRGYGYRRTARRLNALYVEISELTEKSENSLKFFGDIFASRAYRLAAQKLGLNEWKTLVDHKLESAEVLYRSLIDEVSAFRMEFMELAILLILIIELVLSVFHVLPT